MVFRYEKDGNKVRMSTDCAADHDAIPSRTDWERLDHLTDDEITAAIILDPDQPALLEEELQAFLDRLRALNKAKQSARERADPILSEDERKFETKE